MKQRKRSTFAASAAASGQQAGGADVLRVHDEPETLDNTDRPLHLQQWSTYWVGRVGAALSDTARLHQRNTSSIGEPLAKTGSMYVNEAGLPPIYYEQRLLMEEARKAREQHLEQLRLQFQVERRKEQQAHMVGVSLRRQQLQTTARQQLVYLQGGRPKPSTAPANMQASSSGVGGGRGEHGGGRHREWGGWSRGWQGRGALLGDPDLRAAGADGQRGPGPGAWWHAGADAAYPPTPPKLTIRVRLGSR